MSDKDNIHAALKSAGAPDYMVVIITEIVEAKDSIRSSMESLNARHVELNHREKIIEDREQAVINAARDMKQFAERIYGPDSELTKINQKLGAIESAAMNRDRRYVERFQVIDENQTRLKDFVDSKIREVHDRVGRLEERVEMLEKTG